MNVKELTEQAKEIETKGGEIMPAYDFQEENHISEERNTGNNRHSFGDDKLFQMMKDIINIKSEFVDTCNSIGDNISLTNSYLRDQKELITEITNSETMLTEFIKQRVVKIHIADEVLKKIDEDVKKMMKELQSNCVALAKSYSVRQEEERKVNEEIIKRSHEAQKKLAHLTDDTWKKIGGAKNLDVMLKLLIAYSTGITIILISLLINIILR